MAIRVISVNAWGGRLHAPLVAHLRHADPDIVCLQEVLRSPEARSDSLVYRDTAHGFLVTRTSHYQKPGHFADYMLVSPEVNVIRFDGVAQPEVSDHRALLPDLQ